MTSVVQESELRDYDATLWGVAILKIVRFSFYVRSIKFCVINILTIICHQKKK